jgi:phenylacetate-CoA ligase
MVCRHSLRRTLKSLYAPGKRLRYKTAEQTGRRPAVASSADGGAAIPYYMKSVDWDRFMADYPPPPMFHDTTGKLSADALWALQNKRFLERVAEAWDVPFYRRHWGKAGLEPDDIRSLDDLQRIPTFTSDDLRGAIAAAPPFGDHHPFGLEGFGRLPLKLQTSSGTTGLPRPTLFDPVAWEVQGVQMARAFWSQGGRPGDIVQITYTNSLANAAWNATTALHHWLGAVPLTTGAGVVTPTERQLKYAEAWGVNWWFSRGEYLGRLAEVAAAEKFDLHRLKTRFLHSYLGTDTDGAVRQRLEEAWGCPVYDNYGTHEIGLVAFECTAKDRKHLSEDTVVVQTVDVDTGAELPEGAKGSMVFTSLHRSVPAFIRYDLRDVMVLSPRSACTCGLHTRKLSTFLGRADEMVKLRGTNVFPVACQPAIAKDGRTTGDFICVVRYEGEGLARREEMTVRIERRSPDIDREALAADLRRALHNDLGVRVKVEIAEAGQLAELTNVGKSDKARRLLDLRKQPAG